MLREMTSLRAIPAIPNDFDDFQARRQATGRQHAKSIAGINQQSRRVNVLARLELKVQLVFYLYIHTYTYYINM